jgi:N-acetylneuraminic acid mutarotase
MGGYAHSAVWTGHEMIVWGGSDDYEAEGSFGFPRRFLNTGFAYEPASDSWRALAPAPLDPRGWHSAVWTGQEMLVWGGVESPCTTAPCESYPADAAAYDPVADAWREIALGPLSGRVDHSAVWTGQHMVVWGGSPPGGGLAYDDGALYEPKADSWRELPAAPIEARYRHAALWTGSEMVIWGGERGDGGSFADGAAFRLQA